MSKKNKAEILLVIVTFIWGATFVIVKGALEDASPLSFLAVRFILAGALLFVALGRRGVDRQAVIPGAILGVFLFAGYAFQTWGLVFTTPSKSAFITASSVIAVPIILILLGSRIRVASLGSGALGLAGIYLLVLPAGLPGVNRGDVFTLIGALFFAVYIVLVGRYAERHSYLHLVPVQILCVGMLALAGLPLDRGAILHWTFRLVAAVVITAVLATGFAFTVQNWAQQFTPPAHTALIFALEPVFAALTSRLVFGERLGGKALLGCSLVLIGMVVSEIWGGLAPSPVEG